MKDPGNEVDSLTVLLISVRMVVLFLFSVMFDSSARLFYIWPISCVYCVSCAFVPTSVPLTETTADNTGNVVCGRTSKIYQK